VECPRQDNLVLLFPSIAKYQKIIPTILNCRMCKEHLPQIHLTTSNHWNDNKMLSVPKMIKVVVACSHCPFLLQLAVSSLSWSLQAIWTPSQQRL